MSGRAESEASATLDCPVCLEGFDGGDRKPLVLRCGHSLCQACTAALRRPHTCPVCRSLRLLLLLGQQLVSPSPGTSVKMKNPPTNFALLQLLPTPEQRAFPKLTCEACRGRFPFDQAWMCEEDHRLLCASCFIEAHEGHAKSRVAAAVKQELHQRAANGEEGALLAAADEATWAAEEAEASFSSAEEQLRGNGYRADVLDGLRHKHRQLDAAGDLLKDRIKAASGEAGAACAFIGPFSFAREMTELKRELGGHSGALRELRVAVDGVLAKAIGSPPPAKRRKSQRDRRSPSRSSRSDRDGSSGRSSDRRSPPPPVSSGRRDRSSRPGGTETLATLDVDQLFELIFNWTDGRTRAEQRERLCQELARRRAAHEEQMATLFRSIGDI